MGIYPLAAGRPSPAATALDPNVDIDPAIQDAARRHY
jgi:hypothetical protein